MGQELFNEHGVLPGDYFDSSFSDFIAIQMAKSRKDRIQDPLEVAKGLNHLF